jgi:hypothetical protein
MAEMPGAATVWVDVKPRFDADGFDLLAEIRRIVREELRAFNDATA